ncbi:MAG: polyprenyl synthetase family protein [PVC group bacterium]|nr:polyprenyl synthetase family protein [PVC group bacterium]
MFIDLKQKINTTLKSYVQEKMNEYRLSRVDSLLVSGIKDFVLRDGKRIRPTFFTLSYLGYSRKKRITSQLLKTAVAFELLHDFLLIHDDIIDNSNTRRGKPTLHKIFQRALRQSEKIGQDLSIVAGDIIYAMAIDAFLSLETPPKDMQTALKAFIRATVLTGAGEFKDIRNGLIDISCIKKSDIRLNYILKTSEYTFKSPLFCGCILAGGSISEANTLAEYGEYLGEAFQIQDDLIGLFEKSKVIGKSVLSDIIESKKTLPIFLAFKRCSRDERKFIQSCLGNEKLKYADLQKIRKIITNTGAYQTSKNEIKRLLDQSETTLAKTKMSKSHKELLRKYVTSYIKT